MSPTSGEESACASAGERGPATERTGQRSAPRIEGRGGRAGRARTLFTSGSSAPSAAPAAHRCSAADTCAIPATPRLSCWATLRTDMKHSTSSCALAFTTVPTRDCGRARPSVGGRQRPHRHRRRHRRDGGGPRLRPATHLPDHLVHERAGVEVAVQVVLQERPGRRRAPRASMGERQRRSSCAPSIRHRRRWVGARCAAAAAALRARCVRALRRRAGAVRATPRSGGAASGGAANALHPPEVPLLRIEELDVEPEHLPRVPADRRAAARVRAVARILLALPLLLPLPVPAAARALLLLLLHRRRQRRRDVPWWWWWGSPSRAVCSSRRTLLERARGTSTGWLQARVCV